jgi:hypothetical protein
MAAGDSASLTPPAPMESSALLLLLRCPLAGSAAAAAAAAAGTCWAACWAAYSPARPLLLPEAMAEREAEALASLPSAAARKGWPLSVTTSSGLRKRSASTRPC